MKPKTKRTIPPRQKRATLTPEQEKFCQFVALGDSQAEAVRKAWPAWAKKTPQRCTVKGAQLRMQRIIKDRIEELQAVKVQKANTKFNMTLDDVLNEMAHVAKFNVLDYMRPDKNGGLVADFSTMTREQAAALASIEVTQELEMPGKDAPETAKPVMMTTIKFKGGDKLGALKSLGEHLGMKKTVTIGGDPDAPIKTEAVEPKSDIDLARRLVYMLTQATKDATP